MRVLYKNGMRIESDFTDPDGKTFTRGLLCPMAWSQLQNGCTTLCAFYDEEEKLYRGGAEKELFAICRMTGHKLGIFMCTSCV